MELARSLDRWGWRFPFLSSHGGTNPSCPGGGFEDLLQTLLGQGRNDKRGSWMEPPDAADLRGDEASADSAAELHVAKVSGMVFDGSARPWDGESEVLPMGAAQQRASVNGLQRPAFRSRGLADARAGADLSREVDVAPDQSL